MSKEIKKCLVCTMQTNHHFKDCFSEVCECNCLSEIRNQNPLSFEEMPLWFRHISKKSTSKFNRAHMKKGN